MSTPEIKPRQRKNARKNRQADVTSPAEAEREDRAEEIEQTLDLPSEVPTDVVRNMSGDEINAKELKTEVSETREEIEKLPAEEKKATPKRSREIRKPGWVQEFMNQIQDSIAPVRSMNASLDQMRSTWETMTETIRRLPVPEVPQEPLSEKPRTEFMDMKTLQKSGDEIAAAPRSSTMVSETEKIESKEAPENISRVTKEENQLFMKQITEGLEEVKSILRKYGAGPDEIRMPDPQPKGKRKRPLFPSAVREDEEAIYWE